MLTITISVASGADALFSFLPLSVHELKLLTEIFLIFGLILLNLRGHQRVRAIPFAIFLLFVIMHDDSDYAGRRHKIGELALHRLPNRSQTGGDIRGIGIWATLGILLHAYSLGGGTYTGIEALATVCRSCASRVWRQENARCFTWPFRWRLLQVNFTLLLAASGFSGSWQDTECEPCREGLWPFFGADAGITAPLSS